MYSDTITAIATGQGAAAISLIRISGDKTLEILGKIFSRDVSHAPGYTLHHGNILSPLDGKVIDEAMVSLFRAPKSYTGEDMAEISCHGGVFVTREVLAAVLGAGARLAERGEFTRRAYLNGKMDLTEAEAVNDVVNAAHADQLALAGNELRGGVKKLLDPLMDEMAALIGNIEVNIDYPEYQDVRQIRDEEVRPALEKWRKEIGAILERSYQGKIVREGVTTAIIGRTNVGKSSLLNALLEEDKAIVTEIPGTTRDIVEGEVRLANITLHLLDTAGIRKTEDRVESLGIRKSEQSMEKADLLIVVLDGSVPLQEEDEQILERTKDKARLVVWNKSDLFSPADHEGIKVCAKKGEISSLIDAINRRYEKAHEAVAHPGLSNQRQIGLLMQAENSLRDAEKSLQEGRELDLVTIDLKSAHKDLREIEGTYTEEDLLDDIFHRFCLGK